MICLLLWIVCGLVSASQHPGYEGVLEQPDTGAHPDDAGQAILADKLVEMAGGDPKGIGSLANCQGSNRWGSVVFHWCPLVLGGLGLTLGMQHLERVLSMGRVLTYSL